MYLTGEELEPVSWPVFTNNRIAVRYGPWVQVCTLRLQLTLFATSFWRDSWSLELLRATSCDLRGRTSRILMAGGGDRWIIFRVTVLVFVFLESLKLVSEMCPFPFRWCFSLSTSRWRWIVKLSVASRIYNPKVYWFDFESSSEGWEKLQFPGQSISLFR